MMAIIREFIWGGEGHAWGVEPGKEKKKESKKNTLLLTNVREFIFQFFFFMPDVPYQGSSLFVTPKTSVQSAKHI